MRSGWLAALIACLMVFLCHPGYAEIIEKRATHPSLAKKNLGHLLHRARQLAKAQPNDPVAAQAVVGLLLMRLQFYRNYADLDELATLCDPWKDDARAQAQYLCADVDAARHDFVSALKRLSAASQRGGDCSAIHKRIWAIGATLELNPEGSLAGSPLAVQSGAGYSASVLAAARATARGDSLVAVNYYVEAVKNYSDVSPYPIAWAWYQVAELLRDSNPQAAIDYYDASLRYLPDYIAPRVELAALQIGLGDGQSALQNLRFAMTRSDDPDIHALISQALRSDSQFSGSELAANDSLTKAREGFASLLVRHPYAFADHAAEVYQRTDKAKAEQLEAMLAAQRQSVQLGLKAWENSQCSFSAGS